LGLLTAWKSKVAADRARNARDWAQAAACYEALLRRSPYLDGIRVQLGHMYKEMGEFELAAGQYYDVLERRPHDGDLHLQVGHLEKLRRQWSTAIHHYGEALRINPDSSDALAEYRALGGGLSLDHASMDQHRTPELGGQPFAAVRRGSAEWPPPNDPALPPMPEDVREVYAMITQRPSVI
jgi:tetratricopeptide (TPR) repeat protein